MPIKPSTCPICKGKGTVKSVVIPSVINCPMCGQVLQTIGSHERMPKTPIPPKLQVSCVCGRIVEVPSRVVKEVCPYCGGHGKQ